MRAPPEKMSSFKYDPELIDSFVGFVEKSKGKSVKSSDLTGFNKLYPLVNTLREAGKWKVQKAIEQSNDRLKREECIDQKDREKNLFMIVFVEPENQIGGGSAESQDSPAQATHGVTNTDTETSPADTSSSSTSPVGKLDHCQQVGSGGSSNTVAKKEEVNAVGKKIGGSNPEIVAQATDPSLLNVDIANEEFEIVGGSASSGVHVAKASASSTPGAHAKGRFEIGGGSAKNPVPDNAKLTCYNHMGVPVTKYCKFLGYLDGCNKATDCEGKCHKVGSTKRDSKGNVVFIIVPDTTNPKWVKYESKYARLVPEIELSANICSGGGGAPKEALKPPTDPKILEFISRASKVVGPVVDGKNCFEQPLKYFDALKTAFFSSDRVRPIDEWIEGINEMMNALCKELEIVGVRGSSFMECLDTFKDHLKEKDNLYTSSQGSWLRQHIRYIISALKKSK